MRGHEDTIVNMRFIFMRVFRRSYRLLSAVALATFFHGFPYGAAASQLPQIPIVLKSRHRIPSRTALQESDVQGNGTKITTDSAQPAAPVKPTVTGGGRLLPLPDEVVASMRGADTTDSWTSVTYKDGQLTIDAQKSTLAEVLQLVAGKIGAIIELPPGSGHEPIAEHAGPGSPRAVLENLLNGSAFNFVIVSVQGQPDTIAKVLLSVQRKGDPAIAAVEPKAASNPFLSPPAAEVPSGAGLPAQLDNSLTVPKEPMTPDQLSQFMRDKAQELREKAEQEHPQR